MMENREPTQPRGLLSKLRSSDDTQPKTFDLDKRMPLLIAALGSQEESSRLRAVRTLIDYGELAVQPLIDALGAKDEQVGQLTLIAILNIGEASVQHGVYDV